MKRSTEQMLQNIRRNIHIHKAYTGREVEERGRRGSKRRGGGKGGRKGRGGRKRRRERAKRAD